MQLIRSLFQSSCSKQPKKNAGSRDECTVAVPGGLAGRYANLLSRASNFLTWKPRRGHCRIVLKNRTRSSGQLSLKTLYRTGSTISWIRWEHNDSLESVRRSSIWEKISVITSFGSTEKDISAEFFVTRHQVLKFEWIGIRRVSGWEV